MESGRTRVSHQEEEARTSSAPFWKQYTSKEPWWSRWTDIHIGPYENKYDKQVRRSWRHIIAVLSPSELAEFTAEKGVTVHTERHGTWWLTVSNSPQVLENGQYYCSYDPHGRAYEPDVFLAQLYYIKTRPETYKRLRGRC